MENAEPVKYTNMNLKKSGTRTAKVPPDGQMVDQRGCRLQGEGLVFHLALIVSDSEHSDNKPVETIIGITTASVRTIWWYLCPTMTDLSLQILN